VTAFVALLVVAFSAAVGWLTWRSVRRVARPSRRLSGYSALGGGSVAVAALYAERVVLAWTGLDFDVRVVGAGGALMAMFLLAAPLEEAAKVLVIWPLYRTRRIDGSRLGLCYAALAGAGFAAVEGVASVLFSGPSALTVTRIFLGTLAHVFFAGAWGYTLGARGRGASFFSVTWLFAVMLHGLFDHILWGRGPGYLAATLPLVSFMLLGAWVVLRKAVADSAHHPHSLMEPPSLSEMREALRPADKPVMLRWVLGGALVTLGLVLTLVVASVFLGRRLGVDFALADEADVRSAGPLILIGAAVLLAFPIAGYLVARASSAPTVLEPAAATLLALAALVAALALTAPVAVLFALAVAPVALGLACGGAWIGLER